MLTQFSLNYYWDSSSSSGYKYSTPLFKVCCKGLAPSSGIGSQIGLSLFLCFQNYFISCCTWGKDRRPDSSLKQVCTWRFPKPLRVSVSSQTSSNDHLPVQTKMGHQLPKELNVHTVRCCLSSYSERNVTSFLQFSTSYTVCALTPFNPAHCCLCLITSLSVFKLLRYYGQPTKHTGQYKCHR